MASDHPRVGAKDLALLPVVQGPEAEIAAYSNAYAQFEELPHSCKNTLLNS